MRRNQIGQANRVDLFEEWIAALDRVAQLERLLREREQVIRMQTAVVRVVRQALERNK